MRHGPRIDILITDLGLPGMSGCALAETAQALCPGIQTLLIAGYGERTPRPPKGAPGIQAVLSKPFAMSALAAKVQEMLAN
jgi:CheY-like chemotaxis protein